MPCKLMTPLHGNRRLDGSVTVSLYWTLKVINLKSDKEQSLVRRSRLEYLTSCVTGSVLMKSLIGGKIKEPKKKKIEIHITNMFRALNRFLRQN